MISSGGSIRLLCATALIAGAMVSYAQTYSGSVSVLRKILRRAVDRIFQAAFPQSWFRGGCHCRCKMRSISGSSTIWACCYRKPTRAQPAANALAGIECVAAAGNRRALRGRVQDQY